MKRYPLVLLVGMLAYGCENAPKPSSQSNEVAEKIIESNLPVLQEDDHTTLVIQAAKSAKVLRPTSPAAPSTDAKTIKPKTTAEKMLRSQVNEASAKTQNDGLMASNAVLSKFVKNQLFDKVLLALQGAADYTLMKRRSHWRVIQSQEWKTLEAIISPRLKAYDPNRPATVKAITDILTAALEMSNRDDTYERSSGYSLIDYVLTEIGSRTPPGFELLYLKAIAARLSLARQTDERRLLVEIVGRNDRGGSLFAFTVSTVLNDAVWAIRVQALKSLRHCAATFKKCRLSKIMLTLLYNEHVDARTRGALAIYAGELKFAEVTEWCAGRLDRGPMAQACRKALSLTKTRSAFDALTAWIKKRMHQAETQIVGNYGFRDEFKVLRPYADLNFSKGRYYALLFNILGQDMRDGYATGGIVRNMADLEDAKRALSIIRTTTAIYEAKWGKDAQHPSQKFLLAELKKMKQVLVPRAKKQTQKERASTLRIKKR
jgi:hypothetical protein